MTKGQAMATQLKRNSKYSEAEWTARQELAACYRIFAMMGWDEMIFNHITVKVPDEDGAFLINPYGLHFSEVCASNLIKIDIDGNKVDEDNPWHVNKAGFVQHSLFHRVLPDAHAIIHTHTTATVAVCGLEGGLQPVNFYACNFMGQLAYHDFEGVTVREEEGARLVEHLGDKRILIIAGQPVPYCLARIPKAGETRGNLAAESRAMQEIDAEPFEDFTSGAEPVAAGLREGRHCLVDPIFCHLSPAPAA